MVRWPAALAARQSRRRPTLLLEAILLLSGNLLFTALIWTLCGAILPKDALSIAVLAWSLGLRHGADADHISVIDNTVRRIIADGRAGLAPVTTGLFFSLGHSTVVVVVTIIITVSIGLANRLDRVEDIGGIIGPAVSGTMLMVLFVINLGIFISTIRRLRRVRRGEEQSSEPLPSTCFSRMIWPLLKATDRPWKLFPVGLAMSIGFDTTSSIILLSVSAIATFNNGAASRSAIILLALLFTAGMCLVDSADSIMMCYVYTPQQARTGLALFRAPAEPPAGEEAGVAGEQQIPDDGLEIEKGLAGAETTAPVSILARNEDQATPRRGLDTATKISLLTTALSIALAFTIGLIQLMSLAASQCASCAAAAARQASTGDGGLAGRWWLGWQRAADNDFIGIGIVAFFAVALLTCGLVVGIRRVMQRRKGNATL